MESINSVYTNYLINILSPLIYEGIKNIYIKAQETEKKIKNNTNNNNVLKIFQSYLKGINSISSFKIESETNRIRNSIDSSSCIFDELVKAVVKSNISMLSNSDDKYNDYHEKVNINIFIHNCYKECARCFFNYPELFWHCFCPIEIKKNQREALNIIDNCIKLAVQKLLPMKLLINDYLIDKPKPTPIIPTKQVILDSVIMSDKQYNPPIDYKSPNKYNSQQQERISPIISIASNKQTPRIQESQGINIEIIRADE